MKILKYNEFLSIKEDNEFVIMEKNTPTFAQATHDCHNDGSVWPSAYASGAAKRYRSKGGKWKKK